MKNKRLLYFFLFSLLYAWFGCDKLKAQTTTISADCIIKFSFTVAQAPVRAPALGFANKVPNVANTSGLPCTTWALQYQAPTTVSAISIQLDSASDTAGAAGTWGAFSGTTVVGASNPDTTTGSDFLIRQGFNPWVSVKLNSATGSGTITGVALGWVVAPQVYTTPSSGGAGSNVTIVGPLGQALMAASIPVVVASNQSAISTNATIVGPLGQALMAASAPVVIASNQTAIPVSLSANQSVNVAQINAHTVVEGGLNGALGVGGTASDGAAAVGNPVLVGGFDRPGNTVHVFTTDKLGNSLNYLGCTSQAPVSLSGTGYVEIVAGTASQIIKICKIFVTSGSANAPVVNTFSIARATAGTCGTPTVLLAPVGVTGIDSDFGGALQSGTAQSICVSESVANSDLVLITYQKAAF